MMNQLEDDWQLIVMRDVYVYQVYTNNTSDACKKRHFTSRNLQGTSLRPPGNDKKRF